MHRKFLLAMLSLLACAILAQAQGTGTIGGTVSDPSGAVVPSATGVLGSSGTAGPRIGQLSLKVLF